MAPISRSFGTLYIDGRPAEPGVQLPQSAENPKIEIGNSDGRFIHWVVVGGLLVSRYDLVVGISWNALVHNALIESREITIDRLPYRIRLLRRGEDVEDLGEFKQYLRALGSPPLQGSGSGWMILVWKETLLSRRQSGCGTGNMRCVA